MAPYRVVNIGNSHAVKLSDFIYALEKSIGKKAKKTFYQCNQEMSRLRGQILAF